MSVSGTISGEDNCSNVLSVPLSKPYFDGTEIAEIEKTLKSGWVTQGPMIGQFEESVCNYVNAKFAVASSNCTTAMHLAWLILGVGPGDEVLCPSYSFIASANAIRHAGAEPIFVDIDRATLNMDANATREAILQNYDSKLINKSTGRKLKAILVVHQIGIPCDLDTFKTLADQYNLHLVEDAACAIGSEYKHTRIGGSGNICAFSFHPRKVITTGEGGMLTMASEQLASKARVYRAHGMSVSDLDRHKSSSTTFEKYEVVGYNYRMTDIQASVGVCQMRLVEEILQKRKRIASRFNEAFSKLPGLSLVELPSYVSNWNYQSYPIRLNATNSRIKRNEMMTHLQTRGITTRRGIPPIHLEPVYANSCVLPITEEVSDSSIFIPIYAQMEDAEIQHVIDGVRSAHKSAGI